MPSRQSFIVVANRSAGATEHDLRAFLKAVETNPKVMVRQVTGEPPARLKIEAPLEVVDELRQAFGTKLFIEPDSSLKLMG